MKIIPWRLRWKIAEFFDWKYAYIEYETECRFKIPWTKYYVVILKDFWNISLSVADSKELVLSFDLRTYDAVYNIIWSKEFELHDVDNEAHVTKYRRSW